MTNLNLAVYRGNTDTRTVTVTASGAPYDLTGKSLRFVAKAAYSVVDAQAAINKSIVISVPASGIGTLSLSAAETALAPGTYYCEIKLYDAGGATFIRTLAVGQIVIRDVVLQSVT